jgi:hypothetical protein
MRAYGVPEGRDEARVAHALNLSRRDLLPVAKLHAIHQLQDLCQVYESEARRKGKRDVKKKKWSERENQVISYS